MEVTRGNKTTAIYPETHGELEPPNRKAGGTKTDDKRTMRTIQGIHNKIVEPKEYRFIFVYSVGSTNTAYIDSLVCFYCPFGILSLFLILPLCLGVPAPHSCQSRPPWCSSSC